MIVFNFPQAGVSVDILYRQIECHGATRILSCLSESSKFEISPVTVALSIMKVRFLYQ